MKISGLFLFFDVLGKTGGASRRLATALVLKTGESKILGSSILSASANSL